jgi:hypothetical protein
MVRMNLFYQHARFMFGCVAMEIVQPLLLNAVEDRLGQKPREVLEYLLKGYTRQVSKEEAESTTLQLSFESIFQLLSQAQESLGGQSWFDMFVTKPNEEDEKNHTKAPKSTKKEEAQSWFDFYCCTQAADHATKTADKATDDNSGYDPRVYFLLDLFSGMSL